MNTFHKKINNYLLLFFTFFFLKKNFRAISLENAAYGIEFNLSLSKEIQLFYEEKFLDDFIGIRAGIGYTWSDFSFYSPENIKEFSNIGSDQLQNLDNKNKAIGLDSINYINIPFLLEVHPFLGTFSIFLGLDIQLLISSKLLNFLFIKSLEDFQKIKNSENYREDLFSILSILDKTKNADENSEIDGQKIYNRFGLKYEVGMNIPLFFGFYCGFKFKDYLISHMKNEILKNNQKMTFNLQFTLGLDINKFLTIF